MKSQSDVKTVAKNDTLKIVSEFKKLTDNERQLRKRLETIASDIKQAEVDYADVDKSVTYGTAFPDDLERAADKIKQLKTQRNKTSAELQQAIEAVANYKAKYYPVVRDELLKLFADVEAAQAALEDCVETLRTTGQEVASARIGFSFMDTHSRLISGHSLLITEHDMQFFNTLKGEKRNG